MGEATPAKAVPGQKPGISAFGERLRREREKREISLDDVSVSTKISIRMLRALEEEKFDQLPGGIFNKGFVRAYARHLGIDEDQAVADYLEAAGVTAPPAPAEAVIEGPPPPPKHASESSNFEVPWGTLAIFLLVAALAISLWSYHTRQLNTSSAQTPAASLAQPSSTALAPNASTSNSSTPNSTSNSTTPNSSAPGLPLPGASAPTSSRFDSLAATAVSSQPRPLAPATPPLDSKSQTAPPSIPGNSVRNSGLVSPDSNVAANHPAPAPPSATTFRLLIEAQENSWVSITADGKTILEGILIAPAVKAVQAQNHIVVRAGNIGGLNFSFNGKKLALQGDPGEVKTLTFSPNGLEGALPKPPG